MKGNFVMNIYADAATNRSKLEHEINVLNAEVANLRSTVTRFSSDNVSKVFNDWVAVNGIDLYYDVIELLFSDLGLEYTGHVEPDGVVCIRIEGAPVVNGEVDEGFVSNVMNAAELGGQEWWHSNYPKAEYEVYVSED